MKHTPTPWKIETLDPYAFGFGRIKIDSKDDLLETSIIAEVSTRNTTRSDKPLQRSIANIELIVNAVNSHHDLIECLSMVRHSLGKMPNNPEVVQYQINIDRALFKAGVIHDAEVIA